MLLFLHTSAGMNPSRSVPGSKEAAVPAAGADSASHRSRAARPSPLLPWSAASHRLRRLALRISVVAKYLYSTVSASSRGPLYPASTPVPRSQGGPFRPRPRRPSARPHCRSLPGSGSLRSPSPCAVKARHPYTPDRLRGQRSAALRVLGHLETQRLIPASKEKKKQPPAPALPASL